MSCRHRGDFLTVFHCDSLLAAMDRRSGLHIRTAQQLASYWIDRNGGGLYDLHSLGHQVWKKAHLYCVHPGNAWNGYLERSDELGHGAVHNFLDHRSSGRNERDHSPNDGETWP